MPYTLDRLLIVISRPTSYRLSSRLLRSTMLSQSGPVFSPRYEWNSNGYKMQGTSADNSGIQALEGKDVKDLLLNVGSGGGAAAAPAAGGAASGDAAAEAPKEEEKEEGMVPPFFGYSRRPY